MLTPATLGHKGEAEQHVRGKVGNDTPNATGSNPVVVPNILIPNKRVWVAMRDPYNRTNRRNSNWKGGISSVKNADDLLTYSSEVQDMVFNRMMERFTVLDSGCWQWTKGVFKSNGRACLSLGKNRHLAARLMWVLLFGSTNGLCVLHTCDNNRCVSPNHLFLGTNADNSKDMVSKGRSAKGDKNGSRKYPERLTRGDASFIHNHPEVVQGENNPRATLTNNQVREIRAKYIPSSGRGNKRRSNRKELAEEYKVSEGIIGAIVTGATWRSVL